MKNSVESLNKFVITLNMVEWLVGNNTCPTYLLVARPHRRTTNSYFAQFHAALS